MRNTRPPRPPNRPPGPPAELPLSPAMHKFWAAWCNLVGAIRQALIDHGRAIRRLWFRFTHWRCGRAWDRYFRTDPIVLLEQREAESNLALWEEDSELARELGVAPTFRGRSGRIVVGLDWEPYPGNPSVLRAHFIFADGDEENGPWDLATAVSVYEPERWA